MHELELEGKTVTLKIKTDTFQTCERSVTLRDYISMRVKLDGLRRPPPKITGNLKRKSQEQERQRKNQG